MSNAQIVGKIISEWKEKWDKEGNIINQFIYYWISLNAWYSNQFQLSQDRSAIEELKKYLLHLDVDFSNEIQLLRCLDPKLKNVTRNNSLIEVLDIKDVIEFLYTVRNNLFHGHKIDTVERDLQILHLSVPVLEKILKILI